MHILQYYMKWWMRNTVCRSRMNLNLSSSVQYRWRAHSLPSSYRIDGCPYQSYKSRCGQIGYWRNACGNFYIPWKSPRLSFFLFAIFSGHNEFFHLRKLNCNGSVHWSSLKLYEFNVTKRLTDKKVFFLSC